ncbi:MAG: phospholipid carrier-dependent glycosyltransferase, partial [Acidobacteriota bacterium]
RVVRPFVAAPLRELGTWVAGLAMWITVLFALGVLGLWSRPVFVGAFLVLGALGAAAPWVERRLAVTAAPAGGATSAREPTATPEARPRGIAALLWLAGCGAALLGGALFAMAAGPTVSWDADVYHLALPKLFLDHGGFRPVEGNVYSIWPLGVQMIFGLAMAVDDYVLAKLTHFGLGLLTGGTTFLLARRVGLGRPAALAATAAFFANGVVLFEMRVAYVDLAMAFAMAAGQCFLLTTLDDAGPEARRRAHLVLLGSTCGLLAAAKVTGIALAAIALLPLLVAVVRRRLPVAPLAWVVAPIAALWLPWLARSVALTGNPAYPFLYSVFGGPDWSPALGDQLATWQRSIGMGRSVEDFLFLPLRVILEGGEGYARFDGELGSHWLLGVPLAIVGALGSSRRAAAVRRLLLVAGSLFAFWAASSQQMRFLIPMLPLVAVAAAAGLERLGGRWRARALLPAVIALLLMVGSLWAERRLLTSGARHVAIYQETGGVGRWGEIPPPQPPIFARLDALPSETKILFLGSNRRFWTQRELWADSFFEASQIRDALAAAPDVDAALRARSVTHVLWAKRQPPIAWPSPLLDLLRDPRRAQPVAQDDDHVLLALGPGPASSRVEAGR